METAGGVDKDDIGSTGHCSADRIESDRCRVGAHLLLYYLRAGPFSPYVELIHSGGAEGIRRTDNDLFALLSKGGGNFAYGGGLADAVDADNHQYIRLL